MSSRELHWRIKGIKSIKSIKSDDVAVRIEAGRDQSVLRTAESEISFQVLERTPHGAIVDINGKTHRVFFLKNGNSVTVWVNGRTYQLERAEEAQLAPAGTTVASGEIHAPMPGRILRVDVKVDAMVEEKQTILVMESMKMETALYAARAGRVAEIRVQPGQIVEMNELLLRIE